MRIRIVLIAAFVLIGSTLGFAQDHKLMQFQMAILKKVPKWNSIPKTRGTRSFINI